MAVRSKLERATDVVLAFSALVVAGLVVRRELGAPTASSIGGPTEYIENWDELLGSGILVGRRDAALKIIEFGDLECPACRRFHGLVQSVVEDLGDKVAVVFIHYPLEQHRFARPAARVLECGAQQGVASEVLDALYMQQDSLGIKSWASFGEGIGILDMAAFQRCVESQDIIPRIDDGLEMGSGLASVEHRPFW